MHAQPFTLHVDDEALLDLRQRLARTRWQDPLPGTGWREGTDADYLRRLIAHWRDGFDWRAQERQLNALPQFVAEVAGHRIHFVHARGVGPRPLPLILTHGWPGSFVEMAEIVPMLSDPQRFGGDARDAFDVVVPSLPGYGYSSAPTAPGVGPFEVARLWAQLMHGLGHERYGAQGGDWGASVSTWLAFQQPENLVGLHLNFIPGSYRPFMGEGAPALSPQERAFIDEAAAWAEREGAYNKIQATKPQSLAVGLNDSPAGLAAWLAEKFHGWSDGAGGAPAVDIDRMLTSISLYWFTGTIGSSFRMYLESRRRPVHFEAHQRVRPPLGVAVFPHELPMPPRSWVERVYDVRRWTQMARGGHFAAMESPAELAQDVRAFFREFR